MLTAAANPIYIYGSEPTGPVIPQSSGNQNLTNKIDRSRAKKAQDSNIVQVSFDILEKIDDSKGIKEAALIKCAGCQGHLNLYSKILEPQDYLKFMEEANHLGNYDILKPPPSNSLSIPQEPKTLAANLVTATSGDSLFWICEFCTHHNKIMSKSRALISIPDKEEQIYILEERKVDSKDSDDCPIIIFCVDISASMLDKLNKKSTTSPKKYDYVIEKLQNHLKDHLQLEKNIKCGIVFFNDHVTILGDCTKGKVILKASSFPPNFSLAKDTQNIINWIDLGAANSPKTIEAKVSEVAEKMVKDMKEVKPDSNTALGPALATSIGLASYGKKGGKVIVLTDGLANNGFIDLEKLEHRDASKMNIEFLAEQAKMKGVSISIIKVPGASPEFGALVKLVTDTNGNFFSIEGENPELEKSLRSLDRDALVATKATFTLHLSYSLKFRNPPSENKPRPIHVCLLSDLIISTKRKELFEFEWADNFGSTGIHPTLIKNVFLQARTEFQASDNKIYRYVHTIKLEATSNLAKSLATANLEILNHRATQVIALNKANLPEATGVCEQWINFLKNDVGPLHPSESSRGLVEKYIEQCEETRQIIEESIKANQAAEEERENNNKKGLEEQLKKHDHLTKKIVLMARKGHDNDG